MQGRVMMVVRIASVEELRLAYWELRNRVIRNGFQALGCDFSGQIEVLHQEPVAGNRARNKMK